MRFMSHEPTPTTRANTRPRLTADISILLESAARGLMIRLRVLLRARRRTVEMRAEAAWSAAIQVSISYILTAAGLSALTRSTDPAFLVDEGMSGLGSISARRRF